MDKSDFLNFHRPLLTIHFHDDVFLADDSIKVTLQTLPFRELAAFYVLRAVKNNLPDNRCLEDREYDMQSKLITLKEARKNPKKWELDINNKPVPAPEKIHPIPVATDLDIGHTVILDSNHLLANLICSEDTPITVANIVGHDLKRLVIDFIFLDPQ